MCSGITTRSQKIDMLSDEVDQTINVFIHTTQFEVIAVETAK